jgi:hypothetical protein
VVVALVSEAGRTDVLETRSTGNAGRLAVVKVTSDGLGRGTRSGKVGSGVLEWLSASGAAKSAGGDCQHDWTRETVAIITKLTCSIHHC